MKTPLQTVRLPFLLAIVLNLGVGAWTGHASDWPQWRGPNRDGKATGFHAPKPWPKELTQKWKTTVGRGDASPALVGDKVFVFARDADGEITVCLEAGTGKELWRDKYDAAPSNEPMGRHPGPRSSPVVAGGKVVTYGVRGKLSCLDAGTGKALWRKDDLPGIWPRFFTSSSPLVSDGLCVAQLGGENQGGLIAYDLTSGEPKWKWTDDGTAYASPVLLTLGRANMVVALTAKRVVGLALADGRLLWDTPFAPAGRAYNAATPIVRGDTVFCAGSGRGTKALRIESTADGFVARELWSNPDHAVQFNTPVLKDAQLYGLAQNGTLFCLDAANGKTLWTAPLGGRDFGSLLDAGPVLMALTPQQELVVIEPSREEFRKLASYKVASSDIYAHPVVADQRLFIKDQEAVTLWTID